MTYARCISDECTLRVKTKIDNGEVIHRAGCGLVVKREEERVV